MGSEAQLVETQIGRGNAGEMCGVVKCMGNIRGESSGVRNVWAGELFGWGSVRENCAWKNCPIENVRGIPRFPCTIASLYVQQLRFVHAP